MRHQAGPSAAKEALGSRSAKYILTKNLIKTAEFVVRNNYFEIKSNVFWYIRNDYIHAKLPLTHAFTWIDRDEQSFLETQEAQLLLQLRYIDDIFSLGLHNGNEEREKLTEKFNKMTPNLNFTCKSNEKSILLLDHMITLFEAS